MKVTEIFLDGVKILEPQVFGDHRGWFVETFNSRLLNELGIENDFIQDNHSYSSQINTLRGLHYQLAPKAQTKLVRCTKGSIFDVAVDIRKNSPTYGQWFGIELSAENKKQLLVPKGFAHGFLTLTDDVEVQYKVDELYSPEHDRGITWNDSSVNIQWPTKTDPILSDKDQKALTLERAEINFIYGENS
ncbi:dTDP-4-dehydrorhamnose 3,5-epimerase [Exiguobacterium sp. s28]|uniref:dTDP-4-dehydrorhamnose 3,5-epimerase n=1 Tax=Exiguobacterium sp. s28 TaxID=2751238 RepID=UPI001BE89BDC|nr:dTDP-4-dehydrorhamnose 3,5-epimerase [Exiguobacterium sp. s28]